jgi:hypothetical protein
MSASVRVLPRPTRRSPAELRVASLILVSALGTRDPLSDVMRDRCGQELLAGRLAVGGLQTYVAAHRPPFVTLSGEHGTDETDTLGRSGKMPTSSARRRTRGLVVLGRLFGPDLVSDGFRVPAAAPSREWQTSGDDSVRVTQGLAGQG